MGYWKYINKENGSFLEENYQLIYEFVISYGKVDLDRRISMSYIYKEPKQAEGVWKDNEGSQWKYGTMTGQLVGDTRIDQKVRKYTYIIDTDKKLPIEPPRKRIGIFCTIAKLSAYMSA